MCSIFGIFDIKEHPEALRQTALENSRLQLHRVLIGKVFIRAIMQLLFMSVCQLLILRMVLSLYIMKTSLLFWLLMAKSTITKI